MKRILTAILIALIASASVAAGDDLLQRAKKLYAAGKFASAAKELKAGGDLWASPERLLIYAEIVTGGYINQIGFRAFSLRDLNKGETLDVARRKGGPEEFSEEDLEAIIAGALEKTPQNPQANLSTAKYIYDAIECSCSTFEKLEATPDSALNYYLKAYEGGLYDFSSLYRTGFLYQLKGGEEMAAKALSFYNKAYEINSKHIPLRYNMGVLYAMTGLLDKAREHAVAALDGYGDEERDGSTRYLLARIEEMAGNDAEAEKRYRGALEKSPGDPDYFSGLAALLRKRGEGKGYESLVFESVSKDLSDPDIFSAYVRLVSKLGASESDTAIFKKLSALKYKDPLTEGTALFNLGQLAEVLGDKKAARASYSRSLELLSAQPSVSPKLLESLKQMVSRQGQ